MTTSFTGRGSAGNWADPRNWTSIAGPAGIDLVSVSATQSGSFTAPILMLLGQETVNIAGTIATTSTNDCLSFMVCDGATAALAGTAALQAAGGVIVGNEASGTLTAAAHARIAAGNVKIGLHAAGIGAMTLNGATLTAQGALTVGMSGRGQLLIENGAAVHVGGGIGVGVFAGSAGGMTLAGGGAVQVAGDAVIGAPAGAGNYGGAGALSVGAGSSFAAGGAVRIGQHGTITLSGGAVVAHDGTTGTSDILAGGRLSGFGSFAAPALVLAGGVVEAAGGTLSLGGTISGTGTLLADGGATLAIGGRIVGDTIAFAGADATVALSSVGQDMATIANFGAGDTLAIGGVDGFAWDAARGVLSFSAHGAMVGQLHVSGSYASNAFTLSESGTTALITLAPHH